MNMHVEVPARPVRTLADWQADYAYREPKSCDYSTAPLTDLVNRWALISSVTTRHTWPDASMNRLQDILGHLWRHVVDAPITCAEDRDAKLMLIREWIADEDASDSGCEVSTDIYLLERQCREWEAKSTT